MLHKTHNPQLLQWIKLFSPQSSCLFTVSLLPKKCSSSTAASCCRRNSCTMEMSPQFWGLRHCSFNCACVSSHAPIYLFILKISGVDQLQTLKKSPPGKGLKEWRLKHYIKGVNAFGGSAASRYRSKLHLPFTSVKFCRIHCASGSFQKLHCIKTNKQTIAGEVSNQWFCHVISSLQSGQG